MPVSYTHLERIAIHIVPLNGADRTWPSNIVGDAKLFPFRIAGLAAFVFQHLRFICGDLIICHHNATPVPAILSIEQVHCVHSRAASCEEVNDEGIRLIGNKETYRVMDRI